MYRKSLGLKDLVNIEDWQKVQHRFSAVIGLTLRTIDVSGERLTETSGPNGLSSIIPKSVKNYSKLCGGCLLKASGNIADIKEETNFKCALDLDVFILPIEACGNKIVAYIAVGPVVLNGRKSESEYRRDAEEIGIDAEKLKDALIDINVFSHSKMREIVRLLNDTFSYMAQTGYHKRRLGEIRPEVVEMDPLFSRYYEEKVLDAFLNTCVLALNADSGSVMILDKKTNMLQVKAATKTDNKIIDKATVRVGEGIAGVAAATAKHIILPKDMGRDGLSGKMKRQYIKSSMIVPFNKADNHDVYGVLNLNVVRRKKDFSDRDIDIVKELTNLASIALIPIK
ncbi:MAG: PocR ligand-binding domain-containing protein [Candidatus Omnitrophota bacterium]